MKIEKSIALFDSAWRVAKGARVPFAVSRFEKRRKAMSAFDIARLDPRFRSRTRATHAHRVVSFWPMTALSKPKHVDLEVQSASEPAIALLALHAADGFLRERAVQAAPMDDTAALAALMLRCNDWAPPVRSAALKRFGDLLPLLDATALRPLCLFAVDRVVRWERGGAVAAEMIAKHPAWNSVVRDTYLRTTVGPLARTLRQLLRRPVHDWALPDLAMNADSAFVRAVAVEVLLTNYARWTEGFDWVWHDKVFNLRRKVARQGTREVQVPRATRKMVLRSACFDRSARVRCLAADYLVAHGMRDDTELVSALLSDRAKSVQWRMDFYKKKWGIT